MIFECKKIYCYDRIISYCICMFFYLITIFMNLVINSLNTSNAGKYFFITSFLAVSIILTIELHRYPKFNIYKIEIYPDTLMIYVDIAIGRVGIKKIQLDIDKCHIKEMFIRSAYP